MIRSVVDMNALTIVLVAGLVIWTIAGRMLGRPLRQRRLFLIPAILAVVGLTQLSGVHLTAMDLALLVVQIVVGLGIGALRGLTIHLYERDGFLWMRYRWTTLALWVLSIAVRLAFAFGGHMVGADDGNSQVLMIGFGVSLLGEGLIVAWRANGLGIPFAPDDRSRRRIVS